MVIRKKLNCVFVLWGAIALMTSCVSCASSPKTGQAVHSVKTFPEGFVKVPDGIYDGTAPLTPASAVFIPGRIVTIGGLYVCDHEVTQAEYEVYCMYGDMSPRALRGAGGNYPAYYVNWYDALVYCNLRSIAEGLQPVYSMAGQTNPVKWAGIVSKDGKYCGPAVATDAWDAVTFDETADGYRLPTEVEWEYIARNCNRDSFVYAGSNNADEVSWNTLNSSATTHEVNQKKANGLGMYDMSGNVWEWCWDWFGPITADTPAAGSAQSAGRTPRGGSWVYGAPCAEVTFRCAYAYYARYDFIGFRVVRNAEAKQN